MRTRSKSKRPQSVDEREAVKGEGADDNETLSNISRDGVGKLLKKVKKGFSKEDVGYLRHCDPAVAVEREKKSEGTTGGDDTARAESRVREAMECVSDPKSDDDGNDFDETEWEDGVVHNQSSMSDFPESLVNGVSVEFDVSPGLAKRKRATAEEKQVSELVHQAHLLCLLGRGRLIDNACNDPLIQASLLSLVPTHLLKVADKPKLTASCLTPFVNWFHKYFRVNGPSLDEKSCHLAMASTLESQEGTPEAVAALSVALFRALNLTTRFVSILDVVSLKPEADKSEDMLVFGNKRARNIFDSATPMVAGPSSSSADAVRSDESRKGGMQSQDASSADKPKENTSVPETKADASEPHLSNSERLKKKGDLEFEMQLEMALAATAIASSTSEASDVVEPSTTSSTLTPLSKGMRRIRKDESQTSSNGVSTAIGSKKVGAPLYWAEVFCSGENLTGKWVHVDVINAVVDGENKVEAAAAACKKSLRYVVAFAGNGAKDVTRRYCTKWYKVAPQRISSIWWNAVLAPLKELESAATAGTGNLEFEDMELETRELTEPLPTNQQAYRNHHLYVIERWLKKYQILHPKGPVLGFISGHPVYPRACVQTLRTKERWLRKGLQVKAGENPAKILNRSLKSIKEAALDENQDHLETTMVLYGKWQTEPLFLPRAVNGIVPKNERGRVDVWSEKCLPPGTVHLRLPRVAHVARRLGIDFASAMVGFEFRNGKSVPLFEGIVVCAEFKDAVLAAYAEEEERREAEEKRKNEAQALSRWYQLLSSIVTRQRLNTLYGERETSKSMDEIPKPSDKRSESATVNKKRGASPLRPEVNSPEKKRDISPSKPTEDHEHEFVMEEQASVDGLIQIKRCHCGFSVQFEEL